MTPFTILMPFQLSVLAIFSENHFGKKNGKLNKQKPPCQQIFSGRTSWPKKITFPFLRKSLSQASLWHFQTAINESFGSGSLKVIFSLKIHPKLEIENLVQTFKNICFRTKKILFWYFLKNIRIVSRVLTNTIVIAIIIVQKTYLKYILE